MEKKREKLFHIMLIVAVMLVATFTMQLTSLGAVMYSADKLPAEVKVGDIISITTWNNQPVQSWTVYYWNEDNYTMDSRKGKTGMHVVESIGGYKKYYTSVYYADNKLIINLNGNPNSDNDDTSNAEISMNSEANISWSGSEIEVSCGSVDGATGYDIYAGYTGQKLKKIATVKTGSTLKAAEAGNTKTSAAKKGIYKIKKLNGKKLNKKKIIKAYVVAKKGKKKLARSIDLYAAGAKNRYTVAKKIGIPKKSLSLKKGKKSKLAPKLILKNSKKKLLPKKYAPKFRYATSDSRVATVDKNGKITTREKGSCSIFVYTVNGAPLKIDLKVN